MAQSVFNKDLYKGKVVFVVSLPFPSKPPLMKPHLIRGSIACEQTGGGTGICYQITKSMMERESPHFLLSPPKVKIMFSPFDC